MLLEPPEWLVGALGGREGCTGAQGIQGIQVGALDREKGSQEED